MSGAMVAEQHLAREVRAVRRVALFVTREVRQPK